MLLQDITNLSTTRALYSTTILKIILTALSIGLAEPHQLDELASDLFFLSAMALLF
jgi:hypothetical protein